MNIEIGNILNGYFIVFLFPGLIITLLYRIATTSKMYPFSHLVVYSIIFSIINIFFSSLFISGFFHINIIRLICNALTQSNVNTTDFLSLNSNTLSIYGIISIIYLMTIPTGIITIISLNTLRENRKIAVTLQRLLLFSRSDPSLWIEYMKDNRWIMVRDFDNGYAYYGYKFYYTEDDAKHELYLRKVEVKDNTTLKTLYKRDSIYLLLEGKNYVIESDRNYRNDKKLEEFFDACILERPPIPTIRESKKTA